VVPYKRDPETLEGIRGKTGKVYGALFNVLSTMKGLPLEYSFDYQEAIEPTMDAFDSLLMCINSMAALVADFKINRKQMKEAASHSFSTAIDLVDWLVQNCDLTPVEAQETSRNIIEYAINKGKKLSLLDVKEMQKFNKKINDDIYSALIPSRAMILRRSGNGSNPVQVRKAIRVARRKYL
jgi:argininosuccinate lyase